MIFREVRKGDDESSKNGRLGVLPTTPFIQGSDIEVAPTKASTARRVSSDMVGHAAMTCCNIASNADKLKTIRAACLQR
jgi:hypothetical protein